LIVVFADHADGTTVPKIPSRNAVGNQALAECVPLGVPKSPQTPSSIGGSAHSPRRKCAEPRQCAGQVSWLESMMATMFDSENMRSCNTAEFIAKERETEFSAATGSAASSQHMQTARINP